MRIAILLSLAACSRELSPSPSPPPPALAPARAIACKPPTVPQIVPLPARASSIAARSSHACAVLETGRVWCWGNNDFEQAGLAARASETAPHDIGLEQVVEISLGYSTGCARHTNGTTTCWGRKTSWNQNLPQSLAAQIPAGRVVQHVTAGHDHTCAIVRGAVECYGALHNFSGFADQPRVAGVSGATAISAGDDADCAVAGGAVVCWGLPFTWGCDAQCERDRRRPVAHRVPRIADATAITMGEFDACALRGAGRVACWGSINGARDTTPAPVAIAGLGDARQVSSGGYHACAVRATGEIACWGTDASGQRGDGRTDRRGEAPSTVAGIDRAVAVATGMAMSCALLTDGSVTCWGGNDHRQLGFATEQRSAIPVDTCALERATRLAASQSGTCALRADATVVCWGAGFGGELHAAVPTAMADASDIIGLVGGDPGICALDRAGAVRCWAAWMGPAKLPREPVSQIALGRFGLCGVTGDAAVACNGARVPGVTGARRIAVGDNFACALADGGLTCWGPGSYPELPTVCHGDVCEPAGVAAPVVRSLANIVDIAVTTNHVQICARTSDGKVRCVAANQSVDDRTRPATAHAWSIEAPAQLADSLQVVRGSDHACALRPGGRVACWGDNSFGQLGTGTMGIVVAPAR